MQNEGDGSTASAPLPTPIVCERCAATWQLRGGFVAVRSEQSRVWHCLNCYAGSFSWDTASG